MCLDELVLSIWSCKNWNLQFVEKFKNRELKQPTSICISQNSTPKKKNCLKKGVCMREISLFEKSPLLLFFLNCRRHTSKNQMTLDFTSDVQFWWNKSWFGGFLTFWMWCKYLVCTSKHQSSPTKILSYGPMAKKILENNVDPKKNSRDANFNICKLEN